MKKLLLLLLLPITAWANGPDNSVTNNYYTTENHYHYGVDGGLDDVVDESFKISTSMGLAASGVRFRSRESLQWGAAISRYEGVGSFGIGLMQQITDSKLELSGKFVIEDKHHTNGWVIGISGGF